MNKKRRWDFGAGMALFTLIAVLSMGASGFGISYYYQRKRAETRARLQGQLNFEAASGNLPEVRALLQQGAAVTGLSREGHTPLYGTALLGKTEMVRFLLDAGADPNRYGPGTQPPLYAAVEGGLQSGREGLVRLLLEAGADPNVRGAAVSDLAVGDREFKAGEQTPLMRAVLGRADEVVRLLLKHGADASLVDSDGKSALHWWVLFRRNDRPALALGPLLIRKGADPHQVDNSGKSPLDYARELRDDRLLKTLETAIAIRERKAAPRR